VIAIANEIKCGMRFEFENPDDVLPLSRKVADAWFLSGGMRRYIETQPSAFLPYTAGAMTRQLAEVFNAADTRGRSGE
jgi:hypothetical protein